MIDLADYLYSTFGFKYSVELSTRPDDFMGEIETWNIAEAALKSALEKRGIEYTINEGDGAFYGPKIDFHLEDAIGRTWQCGTIQLDFQMPINFDLTYVDENGEKKRPVMLHRALFGSLERFLGILIEQFIGKFPLWLAPVQVKILSISEKFNDYAKSVYDELKSKGYRVVLDDRNEKIGKKIREAQVEKVEYMLIIGEEEVNTKTVTIRHRDFGDQGKVSLDDFIARIKKEIDTKEIVKKEDK